MRNQIVNRALYRAKIALVVVCCSAGFGILKAQDANKNGFQAAGNKGVGFALKEHRNSSWRGEILSRMSQLDNVNLTFSNFANNGDIVFTGGGVYNDNTTWSELFRISNTGTVNVLSRIDFRNTAHNTNAGGSAGISNTTGSSNSNFGFYAGYSIGAGSFNSNFGDGAGTGITTGNENSNFGVNAGFRTTTLGGNSNFGYSAGEDLKGTGNTSLGARAGTRSSSGAHGVGLDYSVFLGYNAGSDFDHVTFEDNANPIENGKSVFVLNNQAQLHNPLLFGTFVDNGDHHDPSAPTSPGSMAQLAINTHHLMDSCALTVAGAIHIGPKNADPSNFTNPDSSYYSSYLLWVEKGVVSEDFAVANTEEWSDYVFKDDYELMKLEDVEHFVKQNHHLPEVPSEAEVKQKGFYDLHEMNMLLLKKVEELTLHAIAQEKEINALRQLEERINELENGGR